jgi:type I restriction enzyme S subunit
MKWELRTLGDLGEWGSGGTPLSSTPEYYNGTIPWLIIEDLNDGVVTTAQKTITEIGLKNSSAKTVEPGTLLIAMYGSIGKLGIAGIRCATNQAIAFCRHNPELVDINFLFYYLLFSRERLLDLGKGNTQQNIGQAVLKEYPIPLPPLTEQKRIASLLARADRLRQLRRTAHDLGDALLQSVFLEMFGDLTVNQKHWDLFFLEDIADVHGGIQVTSTRNSMKLQRPYLRVANVYRNQLELSEIKMIGLTQSEFERTKLRKDDLLFVEGHGNINEIGRAAVWDGSIEDCVHQNHLICARLDLKLANPIFVSTYVNSPAGKSYFTNISNTTSGLNTISTNTVRSCPIPLPPLSLQEEFAGVVARVESLRGRMGESTRQVDGLFESLLAEAFSEQA